MASTLTMNNVLPDYIVWNWQSQVVRVGVDQLGVGPTVLLLPALSSISTRREMRLLQERLASNFTTVAIDWPGFGDEPHPGIQWRPDAYLAFLSYVLTEAVPRPHATVAAGHAASYALAVGAAAPTSTGLLCLIAPTWRGPLPTMMGGKRGLGQLIARVGDLPVLGQLLYRLNVNPPVVRMMARGHVYVDPNWLQGERLTQKLTVVRATGARHASIRFVTGMLDLMANRSDFVEAARRKVDDTAAALVEAGIAALQRAHSRAVWSRNAKKIEGRNAGPRDSPECPRCRAAQWQAGSSRGIS